MKKASEQIVGDRKLLLNEAVNSLIEFMTEKVIPTRAFLGETKALIRSFRGGVVKRDGEDFNVPFSPEEAEEYRNKALSIFRELEYTVEDYEDEQLEVTDGAIISWKMENKQ